MFSEPETQNIKWLLVEHNGIGYYIDIHCFGGSLLHVWGDDENQSENPEMNFNNSAYNDVRGVDGDSEYKEYISKEDIENVTNLTTAFRDSLYRSSAKNYEVTQSFYLYPTAGCSDDYAYSRYIKDHSKKVHGFTLEFGKGVSGDFQPPWEETEKIIIEVSAGLVAFSYKTTVSTVARNKE